MHAPVVGDTRLVAELLPNRERLVPRVGDVLGDVGFLVTEILGPTVFMLFTHALAGRVMVVGAEV
jgi:hypothetical protein